MALSEIAVELESDPVVFELEKEGGSGRGDALLKIWGITGRVQELNVQAAPVPDSGAFHFTVAAVQIIDRSDDPDVPVWIRIPVTCSGGVEGQEIASTLEVTVSFAGGPPTVYRVGLVASVNHVLPLWQVLREEYAALKPAWGAKLASDPVLADPQKSPGEKLAALFALVHRQAGEGDGLTGLSLSGGGIRSATFNLGVLQGLARIGILEKLDYLSSVSGGGYIASWLSGWIYRAGGLAAVLPELRSAQPNPDQPEAVTITHLRQYSNYLTPKLGFLSGDTWTAVAIVVRNILLNQLVLLPVLAAVLALPLVAVSKPLWIQHLIPGPHFLYWAAILLGGVALFFMSLLRASAQPSHKLGETPPPPPPFLKLGLLPLLVAVPLILLAIFEYGARRPGHLLYTPEVIVRCLIWSIVVPMIALAASVPAQRRMFGRKTSVLKVDLVALLFSGVIEAAIYIGILKGWMPWLLDAPHQLYEILGPGLVLGPMLLGKTLFIAFSSVIEGQPFYPSEVGDADREWWARWSGWGLLSALLWMFSGALVFLGPLLLQTVAAKVAAAVTAGGLGGLVSLIGKGVGTPSGYQGGGGKAESPWRGVVLTLAAPLFCLALLLLVSVGTQALFRALPKALTGSVGEAPEPFRGYTTFLLAAVAVLFAFGVLMGRFVSVNRFSLQATYRNRLVRAYLGASNKRRRPNLFTGFDLHDNLRLHALRDNRPLPLISMALNLVAGEDLAWQQRKAENFTATPLHCGSNRLGYRRSQSYGGQRGISLGTAVATSGAAANPNMGSNSSPAITFLMTLFNARLGIWLGNPGPLGRDTWTRSGPVNSASMILDEALGSTDARHPYVNLSDGGHFENLALYEMVRRRCLFIVVGDAGSDPSNAYDDLGNAIRKIRIDFGISIDFIDRINIFPKDLSKVNPAARYCAVAHIHYRDVDGPDAPDGVLIYVKPAICETESYDVYNYARSSLTFPHESTADQWFSESQFESYRALGRDAILTMVRYGPHPYRTDSLSFPQFQEDVEDYIRRGPVPAPT
ncbi:MAG TPA: hypothetical protein VGS07_29310 [Thermoanaerobaculia bacterium]|jgi:hypothetical protein|nr:hypothetical protein [Thermoanaerobaculia bacterium]